MGMVKNVTREIKPQVQCLLWGRAAGRCEFHGCNKPLWKSSVTQEMVNVAQKAHIYAFSAEGPRGHKGVTKATLNNFGNLLLVCHECHRKIDKEKDGGRYTPALLKQWKKEHERRIKTVTGIPATKATHVVHCSANIADHSSLLDYSDTVGAVFPDRHPAEEEPIELGSAASVIRDRDEAFWRQEEQELRVRYRERVHDRIVSGRIKHISVFALAPQPLLMVLGALLTDVKDVNVFAHHREPKGWRWCRNAKDLGFTLRKNDTHGRGEPSLVLSVSGTVTDERVVSVVPAGLTVWQVTIRDPHNDCLKTRAQLMEFRRFMRRALDRIKAAHGQTTTLHVFPAMPAAMAVEFGRIRSPKADMPWRVYDQVNVLGGFIPAVSFN